MFSVHLNRLVFVILCRCPEKGRREVEETVDLMKERDRGGRDK